MSPNAQPCATYAFSPRLLSVLSFSTGARIKIKLADFDKEHTLNFKPGLESSQSSRLILLFIIFVVFIIMLPVLFLWRLPGLPGALSKLLGLLRGLPGALSKIVSTALVEANKMIYEVIYIV